MESTITIKNYKEPTRQAVTGRFFLSVLAELLTFGSVPVDILFPKHAGLVQQALSACPIASVRVSMEEVASSKIMTGGSDTAARAMEISCAMDCAII